MKRLLFLAAGLVGLAGFADDAHPDVWYCGISLHNNYSVNIADQVVTEDGTITTWQDGMTLHIATKSDSTAYFPTAVQAAVLAAQPERGVGVVDNGYMNFTADTFVYKLYYRVGGRWIGGKGQLTLGAGGIDNSGTWETWDVQIAGGIHLGASQTWSLPSGSIQLADVCALSAEEGVTWTISSTTAKALFVNSVSDLAGADVVLTTSARLALTAETATFKAETLTLDWTGSNDPVIRFDLCPREPRCLDRTYAKTVILKGNAKLGKNQNFDGVALDLDNLLVTDGTATIGTSVAYSVKDGGDQLLTVAAGATVQFDSLPTSGRFVLSGAGTAVLTAEQVPAFGFKDFTGTISVTGGAIDFSTLPAGFKGSFVLNGATTLAMPAMSAWDAASTVTVNGTSVLYLPVGGMTDASRIGGTGNYVEAYGVVTETAPTITVGSGETATVAGSGLTAATKIVLAGGTLYLPVGGTVASPVEVTAASTISVGSPATAVFTGAFSIGANLAVQTAAAGAAFANYGMCALAGGGTVTAGQLFCSYGGLELRGGVWSFAAGTTLYGNTQCRTIRMTAGAQVVFADGDSTEAGRTGVSIGSSGSYPDTFEISDKAKVTFGNWRKLVIGDESWANVAKLLIDDATLEIVGEGELNIGSKAGANLKNNGEDRCPRVTVTVRNGGKIVTDRTFCSPPITHQLDGDTKAEGLHLVLDGGTYALGSRFGMRADDYYPHQHPNQLFGGVTMRNVSTTVGLTWTCEVELSVGENGATFDLSAARTFCNSFTNTVAGRPIEGANKAYFPSGTFPTLGPRWAVDGPLAFRGNGNQEFVLNGLDAALLEGGAVTVDGIAVKIVSENSAELETITLGAHGAAIAVVGETEAKSVNTQTLNVLADGAYDATLVGDLVVNDAVFASGATLYVKSDGEGGIVLPQLVLNGFTLPAEMKYVADKNLTVGTTVLSPISDAPETVKWTRLDKTSARVGFLLEGGALKLTEPEPLPFLLLLR